MTRFHTSLMKSQYWAVMEQVTNSFSVSRMDNIILHVIYVLDTLWLKRIGPFGNKANSSLIFQLLLIGGKN